MRKYLVTGRTGTVSSVTGQSTGSTGAVPTLDERYRVRCASLAYNATVKLGATTTTVVSRISLSEDGQVVKANTREPRILHLIRYDRLLVKKPA